MSTKSALQIARAAYQPKLPQALRGALKAVEGAPTQSVADQEEVKKLFPNTYGMPYLKFEPADGAPAKKSINAGVILSGGQAPGGHNVIAGLFDGLKKLNPANKLYGFILGPGGLVDHNYMELTADIIDEYRNTGGFDIIGSGRTKLEKKDQFDKGLEILKALDIKALVIIGGDDSNTNACVLAEYYKAIGAGVQVIGCPKTIDGDLKNSEIETSFGFDTATKVYSEIIGNIERDCNSARKYWHFTLMVYILCYWRVLEPAKNIANAYASIQRGMVSGERLFAILDAHNKITEKADAKTLKEFTANIEYKNVNFSYGETPVLKNISVNIPKGKMVALVGPSGAGKSTFADLLPRFYDVVGGQILIDGVDIRDYTLDSLTSVMGIVTQESILFNDTIYNNITFGMKNVKREDVIEAARIANALEFIEQMPQKFETNIGDRGENLSGGQRQRIAIARAVLKNPPILILDEATSALDTESERLVQDALYKLMQNRTSIVIAHRLSTIRYADDIIVLKEGEIVEEGNHDQLTAKGGIYAGLCAMQVFN